MESRKMVLMNFLAEQQWRHSHREQTCGHGETDSGMNWESSIEIYILPYVKLASRNLLYDARSSNLVLCNNLEGRMGGRWEGGDICIPMTDSC